MRQLSSRFNLIAIATTIVAVAVAVVALPARLEPETETETCGGEIIRKKCGRFLILEPRLGGNDVIHLAPTHSYPDQIDRLDVDRRQAGCVALVKFANCVETLKCSRPDSLLLNIVGKIDAYVGSPVYVSQCFSDAVCRSGELACLGRWSPTCLRGGFCDGLSDCADGLDESVSACGCDVDEAKQCFSGFAQGRAVFPPINLSTDQWSDELLKLSEFGAERVCKALLDSASCFAPLNLTCRAEIVHLKNERRALAFTNSAFYRDFCIKRNRHLKRCDRKAAEVCLRKWLKVPFINWTQSLAKQLKALESERNDEAETMCSALSNFVACFDPIKRDCKYSDDALLHRAFSLVALTRRLEYERACHNSCNVTAVKNCFAPFHNENEFDFPPFNLSVSADYSAQLRALTENGANVVCGALANSSSCSTTLMKSCPPQHSRLQAERRALVYVQTSHYRNICVEKRRHLPVCDSTTTSLCVGPWAKLNAEFGNADFTNHTAMLKQLLTLTNVQIKTVCSTLSRFTTCFKPLRDNCKYSDDKQMRQIVRLSTAVESDEYKEWCSGITCGHEAKDECLRILFSGGTALHVSAPFADQIKTLYGNDRDHACNLTVAFKMCVDTRALTCPPTNPVMKRLIDLAAYVGSTIYKKQCLSNARCDAYEMACRNRWGASVVCLPHGSLCDGYSDCNDGIDENDCDIETCNWIQIEGCLTVLAKLGFAKHLELKAQTSYESSIRAYCVAMENFESCSEPYLSPCLNSTSPNSVYVASLAKSHLEAMTNRFLCQKSGSCYKSAVTECMNYVDFYDVKETCGYLSCVIFSTTQCAASSNEILSDDLKYANSLFEAQNCSSDCLIEGVSNCFVAFPSPADGETMDCAMELSRRQCLKKTLDTCHGSWHFTYGDVTQYLNTTLPSYQKKCIELTAN